MKASNTRKLLLEALREMPVVQIACKKVGVSRPTYYRWRKNLKFAHEVDLALADGFELINDMGDSQLIALIRDKKLGAIQYWLRNHSPQYGHKSQVTGNTLAPVLSEKQKILIEKALKATAPHETRRAT
jgi:hypothetical protein